jgi:hypothetical protein
LGGKIVEAWEKFASYIWLPGPFSEKKLISSRAVNIKGNRNSGCEVRLSIKADVIHTVFFL